jgi:zinc protease
MRSLRGIACSALLLVAAAPAAAAPQLVRTLPNKMTLIVRQINTRPVVSVQAWVRAGDRDDPPGQRGLSEVLGRCLFDRTPRRERGTILKEIASIGGTAGSETHYSYTVYSINVPSRYANQALDFLADAIMHSAPDSAILAIAKDRVRTDSERALAAPEQAAINPIREELHAGTALTSPFVAPPVEVAALALPMVQRFYHDQYVAENLTIVAAGDLDPGSFSQRVERVFAEMPKNRAPAKPRVSERSIQSTRTLVIPLGKKVEGAGISLGFRAPVWGTADALALDVLMALLVDSPTSRLHERLATGEPRFTVAASFRDFGPDGGTITYSLVGKPERLREGEEVLLNELEKVRSAPIASGEFQAAVQAILERELYLRSEFAGIARATGIAAMQGAIGSDEVYFRRLKALKPEDLIAVARKYLDVKQAVVVEMAPDSALGSLGSAADLAKRLKDKQAMYGSAYGSGPPVTASADAERRARVDAPLAAIPPATDLGRGRVERSVMAGGARLLVSEDPSAPLVSIGVYLAGGVRYENDRNNGVTTLLKEALLSAADPKGNGKPYRYSLAELGNLTPYQDRDMWGYSISVPAEKYADALRRLGTMLAHAETDTVSVDAARLLVLEGLDKWLENETAQRGRLIFATKYQVSGYRLPGLGTHSTIIKMPHADVVDFYRKFVVKPNLVVAVFGDVRASDVKAVAEDAVREIPDRPFEPGTIPKEGDFAGFREKWELGGGDYTTVTLAFDGPPATSPDMPAMYVINSVFVGPKGWFSQYVLSKEFIANAASSVAQAVDESPIIASIDIKGTLREEESALLLFRQFKKIGLLPLEGQIAPELVNAKAHAIGTFCMQLDTNGARAFQYSRAELFGLGMDYVPSLPAKMDALSASDLTIVGTKYFQKDDFVRQPYAVSETRPGGW